MNTKHWNNVEHEVKNGIDIYEHLPQATLWNQVFGASLPHLLTFLNRQAHGSTGWCKELHSLNVFTETRNTSELRRKEQEFRWRQDDDVDDVDEDNNNDENGDDDDNDYSNNNDNDGDDEKMMIITTTIMMMQKRW